MTKRKRVNSLTTPIGTHWTITRIVSHPEGKFGFAISDDGKDTCYIPRSIIEAYDMSPDDEGAGFTAPLKPGTGGVGGQSPHVMNPLMWDADTDAVADLAAKIEEMGNLMLHVDKTIEVLTFIRGEISATMKWLDDNYPGE